MAAESLTWESWMNGAGKRIWIWAAICAVVASSLGIAAWRHRCHLCSSRNIVGASSSNIAASPSAPYAPGQKLQAKAKGQVDASGSRSVKCTIVPYTGTEPLDDSDDFVDGQDLRGGMDCAFRVNDATPPFTLHFVGKPDNTLGDIEVSQSGKAIQTIAGHEVDLHELAPARLDAEVTAIDANFDGYEDLELLNNCGATGNCSYDFYLYDPARNSFVHNEFLSGLTSPTFDAKNKRVTTIGNSSAVDWSSATYELRNGKLVEIKKVASNASGVWTYELKDGKMVLTDSKSREEE